jgi:TonB family protein
VWYAARLLTEVEEFEADRDVLCGGEDRTIYIQTIFKQMFGYSPEIANSLRDSLTKKRFIMMTTNFRSRYARLRQAAILPLMLALVVAFGTTARAAQEQDGDKGSTLFLLNTLIDNGNNPIILVDGKVVESVADLDNDMIASITVFKQKTKRLATLMENASISEEDVLKRGIVSVQMVKPENFVKEGEEALYRGVILNYDEEPVVGAVIKVGERGVVTDMNGRFEMRATRGEAGEIVMVGYMKQAIHFSNNADMEIRISKERENLQTIAIKSDRATASESAVVKADKMPSFQSGSLEDFRRWVMTQVRFPKEMLDKDIRGRVVAAFIVDTDGNVSNVDILQSPDKAFSNEVIRVLMNSPKWEAGVSEGKPVKVKYTIPVDFAIHDGEKLNASKDKAPASSATTAEEVVVTGFGSQK